MDFRAEAADRKREKDSAITNIWTFYIGALDATKTMSALRTLKEMAALGVSGHAYMEKVSMTARTRTSMHTPAYAFTTAEQLTAYQRTTLIESVTSIHQGESTAPCYFVQVVFYKIEPSSIFIRGEATSPRLNLLRADTDTIERCKITCFFAIIGYRKETLSEKIAN